MLCRSCSAPPADAAGATASAHPSSSVCYGAAQAGNSPNTLEYSKVSTEHAWLEGAMNIILLHMETRFEAMCSSAQPRKYPEEERDIMLEDEIASLPTEEERRREVRYTAAAH